jgi:F-type H+-transporting ATPase subunit gamma
MASQKDIRKRINTVKSTRQITRAMKMVAAAKLRRAQESILASRPYAYRIYAVVASLAKREGIVHPLLVERPEKKIRVVVMAGDRGLCGAYNSGVIKEANRFLKLKTEEGCEVSLACIGKKANDLLRRRWKIEKFHEGLLASVHYSKVGSLADEILEAYKAEELDAVYLIYNEFKSAIQQKVTVERLIPVALDPPGQVESILKLTEQDHLKDYLYEPSQQELLNELIPRHFLMQLFRAVLESVASEHGARMSAMENATKNASEMIDSLTLEYNKARQASITKELMEIVGGVEAMR